MLTATPLGLLLLFVAVPLAIGVAIASLECATLLRSAHRWGHKHPTP